MTKPEPTLPTLRSSHVAKNELVEYVAHRLESLRAQLESTTLSHDQSQEKRGRIAELKKLADLVNNRTADE